MSFQQCPPEINQQETNRKRNGEEYWHQPPKQVYNEFENSSSSTHHQSQKQPGRPSSFPQSQQQIISSSPPHPYQSSTPRWHQTPKQSYEEDKSAHAHEEETFPKSSPRKQISEYHSKAPHGKQIVEENQSLLLGSPQFPKQDSSRAPQPDRKQSYGEPPKRIHGDQQAKLAPPPQNQKSEPVIPYPGASENKEEDTSDLFPNKNVYRVPPEPPSPGPPCCIICCAACIKGFKDGIKESIQAAARRKVQLETDVLSPKKGTTNYSFEVESWIPELDDIEAALAEAEKQKPSQTCRPFAACGKLKLCTKQIQRSCSYVLYYKRYVKQLEHGIEMVCNIRDALRIEVAIAQSQKKSVSPVVVNWIAGVDKIEPETRRFIGEAKGRKHYLCWPMARYSLSCKCVKKCQQLLEIEREGKLIRRVADPAVPPPRIGSTSVRILMPEFSRLG